MTEKKDAKFNQMNDELAGAKIDEATEQYLTFYMGGEEFGVNILSVQEIRGWEEITSIPNSPKQVLGVMNLRGTVSPIVDLRYCFGIQDLSYTDETVVIIVSVQTEANIKVIGIVVDAVSDVYNFSQSQIQPSPELSQTNQAQYVKGLGSTDEKMVILLELSEQLIADTDVISNRQLLAS